jgi:hypothetical protein
MRISRQVAGGRRTWDLDNERLAVTVMEGGGHIAGLALRERPRLNPLWVPAWKTREPWQYRPARDAQRTGSRLLASICGHNLCLGMFGDPSAEEARAGLGCHGEAPVARWQVQERQVRGRRLRLRYGCELPVAQMRMDRVLSTARGSNVVHVRETITSLAARDMPFTLCEHVTFGPPFLEKGVTVFDCCATQGHTFPGPFGSPQRFRPDTAFQWPAGPGVKGRVDLRSYERGRRRSSDFTTQLMDPQRETAWFSALNPRAGLLVAYVWRRADFPWLGNWEENYGRRGAPWQGRSLTRGMEFANTPFPQGLRTAVDRGVFQGERTYRWLPARAQVTVNYAILVQAVPQGCRGVADIQPRGTGLSVDLVL